MVDKAKEELEVFLRWAFQRIWDISENINKCAMGITSGNQAHRLGEIHFHALWTQQELLKRLDEYDPEYADRFCHIIDRVSELRKDRIRREREAKYAEREEE